MLPQRYDNNFDGPENRDSTEDRQWWAQARCNDSAGTMSGLFFSEELHDISTAKRICGQCPVMAQCLAGALDRREPWGVWGGQLLLHGRVLTSKRRRGRPPTLARPEDQFPDIPIPGHLQNRVVYQIA